MSAVQFDLVASAAQTGNANGAAVNVAGIKEMTVFVNVTAGSGTVNPFRVWLESSDDGGTTWYEIAADEVLENGVATPGAPTEAGTSNQLPMRDLITKTAVQTSLKVTALYTRFGNFIRARWAIGGAAPSETFSVKAVGKT